MHMSVPTAASAFATREVFSDVAECGTKEEKEEGENFRTDRRDGRTG